MALDREPVYEQVFDSEQAGELVAWVGVASPSDSFDSVSVALARVSDEGASYTVYKYPGDEETSHSASEGFEDNATVRIVSRTAGQEHEVVDERILANANEKNVAGARHAGSIALVDYPDLFPGHTIEHGEWHVGASAIVEGVKNTIEQRSLGWMYSNIYYVLAYASDNDALLADPAMNEATLKEREHAARVKALLEASRRTDTVMMQNLTVFGEYTPGAIPEEFINMRREVAAIEAFISEVRSKAYLAKAVPSVGFRPNGRTWPYMDPIAKDESKAFGRELDGLRNKSIEPANNELSLEIGELDKRIGFADIAHAKATALIAAEQAVSLAMSGSNRIELS